MRNYNILIFGLPGSGKTTLAKKLREELKKHNYKCSYFNADEIRNIFDDWDFSMEGRQRQAVRMLELHNMSRKTSIVDFVCPYDYYRRPYNFKIWMNTIKEGRFEDTNKMFQTPKIYHYKIDDFNYEETLQKITNQIISEEKLLDIIYE